MSFLHGRIQGLRSIHAVAAAIGLLVAYYATLFLHPNVQFFSYSFWKYLAVYPSLIFLGHFLHSLNSSGNADAYHQLIRRFKPSWSVLLATREMGTITLTLLIGIVLTKDMVIARSFLIPLIPILWVSLIFTLYLLQTIGFPRLFRGRYRLKTLLVADLTSHDPLLKWLEAYNRLGLELAWVHSRQEIPVEYRSFDTGMKGVPVERVIANVQPDVVICSDARFSPAKLIRVRQACEECGSRLAIYLAEISGLGNSASVYSDYGHAFAVFRHEPLESPFCRLIKRVFDLSISLPVVIFILPVLSAMVALIHRFQSPGPLFYKQDRGGAGRHVFKVYKFRTMHPDHGRDGEQAKVGDDRIFRAGHWLRKFSIDEFPQFINVLRGDMSVVGPRPHFVDHDAQFADQDPLYRFRKLLKPGVTGLAQIEGYRGETRTRADVRVRSYTDINYLENWSLLLDIIIVFKTMWRVMHPPGTAV